jgi:hypothetical protein
MKTIGGGEGGEDPVAPEEAVEDVVAAGGDAAPSGNGKLFVD